MRVVVVTKEQTDYARSVDEYLREYERRTGRSLEVINPETPAGISFCTTYDIVRYPTIVALSDEGQVQQMWVGEVLPTISEVTYYG